MNHVALASFALVAGFALAACSSEPAGGTPLDASSTPDATGDAGGDAGGDAQADAPPATGTSFTVPSAGGNVTVAGASQDYTFEFPPSAAGLTLTITPVSAATFGLVASRYREFFKLGPSGTVFTEPVKVRPKDVTGLPPIALLFADGSKVGTYSRLKAGAYQVSHFSGFGVPSTPQNFCAYVTHKGGLPATDFCLEYSVLTAPATYLQKVTTVGSETATLDCQIEETCGLVSQVCCVLGAAGTPIGSGKAWCPSPGGDGQNFTTISTQSCKPVAAPDAGPQCVVAAYSISGPGCNLTISVGCAKAVSTASCDGVTCTCGGKTFPQAEGCENGESLKASILANCL